MSSNFYYWRRCPFCGRYGYNVTVKVYSDTKTAWAECDDCHARGPAIYLKEGMMADEKINLARGAWNSRGITDKMISVDEQLRRMEVHKREQKKFKRTSNER